MPPSYLSGILLFLATIAYGQQSEAPKVLGESAESRIKLEDQKTGQTPAASPVTVAAQAPLLETLNAFTDASSGACFVISDMLISYCAQYPKDQSCKTP